MCFFLFSTLSQVPQRIIGMSPAIYQIEAFSFAIRLLKKFHNIFSVSRITGLKFSFLVHIWANKENEQFYNNLFMPNLSPKHVVSRKQN